MRKTILLILCAALLLGGTVPCHADQVGTSATAAILLDADTGEVLYEKNADRQMLIASTTKILTALVALEQGGLQKEITVTADHMVEGSSMYLKVGETVTVEQLGMENSSFANPNGLDAEGHYSTARDMARLAAYAVQDPTFVRLCSTVQVSTAGRTMTNHNRLLREVEGCIGLKTGYTMAAGRTLVSCVTREGRTLVAVTLQDSNDWADHKALYEYGFDKITAKEGTP